jgi:CheY-like chemotaxis protein
MKQVVLIDDDEISNFVNSQLLLQTRFVGNVHSITSAEEAIQYFGEVDAGKAPAPDLVFVDIRMPVMDGFSLAQEIMKRYPDLHGDVLFYFLSSSLDPKDIAKAEATELCSGFLRKPLSKAYLEEIFR